MSLLSTQIVDAMSSMSLLPVSRQPQYLSLAPGGRVCRPALGTETDVVLFTFLSSAL